MFSGIALAGLTGLLWTLVGIIYSGAAGRERGFVGFMFSGALVFILTSWTVRFPEAAPLREVVRVASVMLPAAILGLLGFWTMQQAMRRGSHGTAWSVSQAAMVFPFLCGWLWFGNPVNIRQFAGLAAILICLPLLAGSEKRECQNRKWFIFWCASSFILIGAGQVFTLFPNQWTDLSPAAATWRVPLLSLGGLGWGAVMIFQRDRIERPLILRGLGYGLTVAAGQFALYLAIDRLAAEHASGLVYPIAITGCILFFFIYCRTVRNEKSPPRKIAAVCILLLGIILLALP